jgi:DeoR/GlpR family transcriptional regulator of sugar metabolism
VAHPVGTEPVWQERLTAESALRREAIALQGIKFIEEGDVLVVGPGATTYILAKHLAPQNRRLTIFTNNLAAATCFKAGSRTRVVVAPGDYDMAEGCTVGPETNAFFAKFRFDTMFFSVGGLTPEGGSDSVSGLAWSERTMLERSSRRILLVDHTKFNTAFLELVCPLSAIDIVVVDRQPSGPLREALALAKVNVVSAGEELALTSDANVTSFPTQLKSESLPERTDDAQ